jgi:hypothetical protein
VAYKNVIKNIKSIETSEIGKRWQGPEKQAQAEKRHNASVHAVYIQSECTRNQKNKTSVREEQE